MSNIVAMGAYALIECTSYNLAHVELRALASGTSYMCTQRTEKNEAYTASDFYYSAVVVLVERGLLHGHIARGYKNNKDPAMTGDWLEHSQKLAAQVGFCATSTSTRVCEANLQKVKSLISCTALQKEINLEMPDATCIGASKH